MDIYFMCGIIGMIIAIILLKSKAHLDKEVVFAELLQEIVFELEKAKGEKLTPNEIDLIEQNLQLKLELDFAAMEKKARTIIKRKEGYA